MKAPDSPWEKALELLEADNDINTHRAWPAFKQEHNVDRLSTLLLDLRDAKTQVEGKHSSGVVRTMSRLDLLHTVAGETLEYAP